MDTEGCMTYAVFFRPAGNHGTEWEWMTPPEGIDAGTPGGAIRATWDHFAHRSTAGEWMAYPVEGSVVFGVEMTVRALRQDGKRVVA